MKALIGLMLCVWPIISVAQDKPSIDGTWIKKSIDAYDRVTVTRNGTNEDLSDSQEFIHYVAGMLAVHRMNNLMASMIAYADTEKRKKTPLNAAAAAASDERMRAVFAFTPLLAVPDTLSTEQIVAILRKYLNANPEKWGSPPHLLITDAFREAFARK